MKWLSWSLTIACSLIPVQCQSVNVIFRGKVVMADGSAPGKSVGTQRTCTDANGTAPGPLTDKAGVFTWRMEVDYMRTRRCFIVATLNGYESSQVEISNVNPSTGVNVDLAPIKLTLKGGDPYMMGGQDKDIPAKGRGEWNAAMKAVDMGDLTGATQQLKAAVATNPKFALAWHDLGILNEAQQNPAEARAAYTKAIEADPKMLAPYAALNRLLVKTKDWQAVLTTSAAMIPVDKDRIFPELYAHQAAAHYYLKDLPAAEAAAMEALNPKAKRTYSRAEYMLGRILEAKGDMAGAKQHMTRYLGLVTSEDAMQIQAHMDAMGKPDAPEPDLEWLTR